MTIYQFVDKYNFIKKIVTTGGIKLKWSFLISGLILIVISIFLVVFFFIGREMLLRANDRLCKSLANSISATEGVITAEKKEFKRSLILQDMLQSISSGVDGLIYATIYDLSGSLGGKMKYSAHTNIKKQGTWIYKKLFNEIKNITEFEKKKVIIDTIKCFQYRVPFKFFKGSKSETTVGLVEIVFTEESVTGVIRWLLLFIATLGGACLVVGIVISIKTTSEMIKPIQSLHQGMNCVAMGDTNVTLNIERHDEIGDLGIEFNNMIDHLRDKLELSKHVSSATAIMISKKSKDGEIKLGSGEKKNYAFLFSDVRGFTSMSEEMQPEAVVSILNEYLDLQTKIIHKNNGDIDKYVGDEIMAFYDGRKKVDNAIKTSVDIINEIKKFNIERTKSGLRTIEIGIGIHCGDVIHGRMGSRTRMDNTSIGDTVNLSARLCSNAKAMQILVSEESIKKMTKGKFKTKKLDDLKVKGKQKLIKIYSVEGRK